MATTTPNIGLTLPAGTEGWKRSVINGNFTILDTKIGAVGNTPLQTQINTLSSQLTSVSSGSLHDIVKTGVYFLTSAVTDKPVMESGYGGTYQVAVGGYAQNPVITGTFISAYDNSVWSIKCLNGTWTYTILTRIYKKTIADTTLATGAIDSRINVDNYYIISAALSRNGGVIGFAFWRGDDGYLRCFDINMQPIANTAVSIDILYCKRSEVRTE